MKKSTIFTVVSILMIITGFILFIINGFVSVSSVGKGFSPALLIVSILLFIGGACCLAVTSVVVGKNKIKQMMDSSDGDLFGHTMSTIKKHFEKTNLELDNEIQDLQSKKTNKKCPNCGASNLDKNGKCPYCGQ